MPSSTRASKGFSASIALFPNVRTSGADDGGAGESVVLIPGDDDPAYTLYDVGDDSTVFQAKKKTHSSPVAKS